MPSVIARKSLPLLVLQYIYPPFEFKIKIGKVIEYFVILIEQELSRAPLSIVKGVAS